REPNLVRRAATTEARVRYPAVERDPQEEPASMDAAFVRLPSGRRAARSDPSRPRGAGPPQTLGRRAYSRDSSDGAECPACGTPRGSAAGLPASLAASD